MDNWESDDWYQKVFAHINQSVEKGAVGIKIWKNIGMEIIKSSDHSYIMIDDLFFDPLFTFLIKDCSMASSTKPLWRKKEGSSLVNTAFFKNGDICENGVKFGFSGPTTIGRLLL